jgi:hypothetical protein
MNGCPNDNPVSKLALGTERVLAERNLRNIEAFLEMFPGVERVMIDGTERPIQRPKRLSNRR